VLGAGIGLPAGLIVALFPFAAVGGGLLAGTTAGGAILTAVAGHTAAGISRHDLKARGEQLDAGQAGLVVVAVSDAGANVERAMKRAAKIQHKQLKADIDQLERDAVRSRRALTNQVWVREPPRAQRSSVARVWRDDRWAAANRPQLGS